MSGVVIEKESLVFARFFLKFFLASFFFSSLIFNFGHV